MNLPINQIILGDCLEVMRGWPDKCIDLIVTDPPYGVGFRRNGWDKEIPDWIGEGRRVANAVIFTTAPLTLWDYPKPDWVCCWYRPASSARAVSGGFNHWSPVVVYGDIKFAVDSINLHAIQYAQEPGFPHPSPKPIELMRWIISQSKAETVLDPFAGSGTTCVAAKQLGRRYIGIEISEKYVAICKERLKQEVLAI